MYCACIGIQLPHIDKQSQTIVRSSTKQPSAGVNVLTIPETDGMACASTAIINPNIPQILVKGSASAQILRDPAILIEKVVVGSWKCISATSSRPIQS
jgi:hypothetical protein